jgi:chromosome segregation ATPase
VAALMPDLSLAETILALTTALGAGGTAVGMAKRPRPGTPEDHELRLQKLEAKDDERDERFTRMEARMGTTERDVAGIAGALGPLTASINRLTESTDQLEAKITELDVEARVERAVRERSKRHRSKTDTDPDKE